MNPTTNSTNPLNALSNALADAVEQGAQFTVLVHARRRLPTSGIAYAADLVLTVDHGVEMEEDIPILLPNNQETRAVLAGRDPARDLALLRLKEPLALPAVPASQLPRIGELALALGRPGSGGVQASLGVISAFGGPARTGRGGLLDQFIRTDTIPYPGFSGGPLINAQGEILGINTSAFSMDGLITIPAQVAWQSAADLAQYGHIRRGYLGIRSTAVELPTAEQNALERSQAAGLLIAGIEENSPAARAGLLVGDILVGLDANPLTSQDDLQMQLNIKAVGQPVVVQVLRAGRPQNITVTLGERA